VFDKRCATLYVIKSTGIANVATNISVKPTVHVPLECNYDFDLIVSILEVAITQALMAAYNVLYAGDMQDVEDVEPDNIRVAIK
jgi:hypothetical protein